MMYVIWSFEHGQWWGPAWQGYTPDLEKAGRYDAKEAGEIVTQSVLAEEVAIALPTAEEMGKPHVTSLWPQQGKKTFTCPDCGRTSHNPNDAEHRYCGACHKFFD